MNFNAKNNSDLPNNEENFAVQMLFFSVVFIQTDLFFVNLH